MLPKNQRIGKALASNVFIRGSSVSSPHFLFRFEKSPQGPQEPTRFAVSVSKKIAKTAVLRNRTRRRVYSVLRDIVPAVKSGFLVAISAKKGGERIEHVEILKEIKGIIEKSGLLK